MVYGIRKSSLAGSWYADKPKELRSDIVRFLQQASGVTVEGTTVGLVVPHAGYLYSGQVAAYAYQIIRGQSFDAVIVIGPSHRVPFSGVSLYDEEGFETPLGVVTIDGELAEKIKYHSKVVSVISQVHHPEHSIEIQLPFLQVVLGNFSFIPLLMGNQDRETCRDLASAIAMSVGDKRVLLVGSSDLSHFHQYDQAIHLDSLVLSRMANMDAEGLLSDLESNVSEACGGGPATVVMLASQKLGADKATFLKYANSGDVTGDKSSVVGYAAVAFSHSNPPQRVEQKERAADESGVTLTEKDKQFLLTLARTTIEAKFAEMDVQKPSSQMGLLKEHRGAFVTLKKHGRLRGCIGYIEAKKSLYETIEEMAIAAAFHDPRFPPVQKGELRDICIEISVLSPLKEIQAIQEIEIGRHGIYITKGTRSGLLLPQVATEYAWDKETFLQETCRKAGLPIHAWQDNDTKIFIFSADIFP